MSQTIEQMRSDQEEKKNEDVNMNDLSENSKTIIIGNSNGKQNTEDGGLSAQAID